MKILRRIFETFEFVAEEYIRTHDRFSKKVAKLFKEL